MTKKILLGIAFAASVAACTEDFKDWDAPQVVPQPETVSFADGSVATVSAISLNALAEGQDSVQVCQIKAPTASNTAYKPFYTVTLGGTDTYQLDAQGRMAVADLQDYMVNVAKLGSNPNVSHVLDAVVEMWIGDGLSNVKTATSGTFQITASPKAPIIEVAYYLTGTLNGWDNTDKTYKMTNNGGDPYENPTYTCRLSAPADGADVEFKMTPESGIGGDWSGCLAAGDAEGTFVYNNAGGNLVIKAVEGAVFYDLTFNMLEQTWSAKALLINIEPAYYLTGSINGWNNSDTTYKLTNDGSDPYENPTFTCRIPATEDGSNIEFKMTPESGLGGDWSKCLAAGNGPEGTFAYDNQGGNLVVTAVPGAKFYDLTFNMMELTWSYKAVNFDPFVYFIGATDGWANADQKLALMGEDGTYTGYLYVADPNGWGLEFKFQKVAGSWDDQLNSNNLEEITGDFEKGSDNIKAAAGEGVYYVTLNLSTNVLSALKITNMNLVGDFNGWNQADDAQQMTWDANEYCYVFNNAGVTASGWKFTANNDWAVNLGYGEGNVLTDLVANGGNITATGSTIKLYPTRKTSDKIYCTVE
jgi:hypothetical protein